MIPDLPATVAPLLGGLVLLLSFTLVLRRQVVGAIDALAGQGLLLALIALCHAYERGSATLVLVAALLAAGQALLLPLALREWVRRQGLRREPGAGPTRRTLPGLVAAVGLVLLAALALRPVTGGGAMALREGLVLALSVVLVGLLAMAARKGPLGQAIGLSSLTNGALLGALAVPDLPLLPAVAVVAMAVPFATVAGYLTLRPQAGRDPQ
jgi:hydrogenase-4 component E